MKVKIFYNIFHVTQHGRDVRPRVSVKNTLFFLFLSQTLQCFLTHGKFRNILNSLHLSMKFIFKNTMKHWFHRVFKRLYGQQFFLTTINVSFSADSCNYTVEFIQQIVNHIKSRQ